MIPQIIHYCWLSNDSVPKDFLQNINGWKRVLKNYHFIKWDFSIFDKDSSSWVSEAFDNKKYAFAADYIRLYALYTIGGIYLDMDIEVIKSFDHLLDYPYMFAYERPNAPWIEAGCIGAEKGNYFIKKCLDYYNDRHFIKQDGSLDLLTLPRIMEKVRAENEIELSCYPWTYFTAKSYQTGVEYPTSETCCIHHFAGSWKTAEEKENYKISQKYSRILGHTIGHNIADYKGAIKKEGVSGIIKMTKKKIIRKINNKNNTI